MVKIAFYFLGILSLQGCIAYPDFSLNGKYSQMYIGNKPVMQINFKNDEDCKEYLFLEYSTFNYSARRAVADKKFLMGCYSLSIEDKLPYEAQLIGVLTGDTWKLNFISKEACILQSETLFKNKFGKIICPI